MLRAGKDKRIVIVSIDNKDELVKVDYSKISKGKTYLLKEDIYFGPNFAIIQELSTKEELVLIMEEKNVYVTVEN